MNKTMQPKTGQPCSCKPGNARDNCALCEGTGWRIDFAAIREATQRTAHDCLPGEQFRPDLSKLAGRYRTPDGRAMIEWAVTKEEKGPEFSATGEYNGGAGQCVDEIAKAYPNDAKVQRIATVWREYHLNGMNSGVPVQTAELDRCEAQARQKFPEAVYSDGTLNWYKLAELHGLEKSGSMSPSFYDLAKFWLKRARLYEVPIHQEISNGTLKATGGFPSEVVTGARGYKYGERWVYRPIPEAVLAEIASWANFGPDDGRSLHECQSDEFLARNGIACRITLSDSKPANWEPSGHHYRVTLSAKARRMTFDFWDSYANAEAGKAPTVASVLSCIASDLGTPETFEDFCSEYGEDNDSRKAFQTFKRAANHADRLRAFFTDSERDELGGLRG